MTKISQYSTDVNITGNDKWIGSDAQNFLITKNFTPNNLANYFNENNVIDIGASIRYRYQTLLPGEAREQGTISFETEIGPQVNFSDITTFLIAKNTLKGNTVTQYLDFLVDGKVLLSKASNINIFGYYKITSIEPWIPNTNFFVVEVDFLTGNGFISEDLDYLVSLVDKVQDIPPPVWGSITGDIEDQTDLINYISSQITTPTLASVLAEGNTTGGENISISEGDSVILDNGSKLIKGTTDSGNGGNKGIALRCSIDYELKWEAGRLYVMEQDGFTIREVKYNFTDTPTTNDDNTKGFIVGSRWILDNDDVYSCTDDTTGAAVWQLIESGVPTLQQVLDNNHDLVDGNFFAGTSAGFNNTGNEVIALGGNSAEENTGNYINSFGFMAGVTNIGDYNNFLGTFSGSANEGDNVNAFGGAACNANTGDNVNALGAGAGNSNTFNNVNLFGENATADENGQTVLSKDGTIMARISTTDLTDTRKYNLPNASGTIALTSDIPAGGVTAVTATSPITSSGGTTPVISTSMATNKLIGRSTAGTGVMEEITIGTGLSLTGGTLSSSVTSGIPHATASGTDTYTATITGVTAYNDADAYLIRFTNGNTTGATLNINGLGAVPLYRNNDGPLLGGDVLAGGEMLCIYNSTTNRFQVIGISPNSLIAYVTNDDSVTITKGMPVYAFSGQGDRMTVKRANNTGDATSAQTVGLVLSTSIAANQKGFIMMQGLLDGLSILPTATWADGDPVYLGATAGTITNVKPHAPNHLVYLGVVTTASNGSAGRLYVRVQNGYELQELHNVQAQSPSLNDTLWYDNTVSPGQWKTASIPTILGYTPPNLGLVQAMTQGLQNIF